MPLFSIIAYLVLPLIMKTGKNLKYETMVNLPDCATFKELYQKSAFLKIEGRAFEAGDFLNIFLRFWVLLRSFSL